MTNNVLTYGTFDLLHIGHINILRRAREMGDALFVGLSTDAFNVLKHKESILPFDERKIILESLRFVDSVFPEETWEQKRGDIQRLSITTLVMGDDWKGKFDDLSDLCEVVYLPRTPNISSALLKRAILPHA